MLKSFRELKVWQKSFELTQIVYRVTKKFPIQELYGLTSQMRRSAVSIPSNIAEGYNRQHSAEYIQFLAIALGSAAELETQILLVRSLDFLNSAKFSKVYELEKEVDRMLYALIKSLKVKKK